jgi:hypothetical protein
MPINKQTDVWKVTTPARLDDEVMDSVSVLAFTRRRRGDSVGRAYSQFGEFQLRTLGRSFVAAELL